MNREAETGLVSSADVSDRFKFGENWNRFLRLLTDDRIADAEQSLKSLLSVSSLDGSRFLDIGAGSGLFSLAARNLGASVYSFDFDEDCVDCVRWLKSEYATEGDWRVERASVLDDSFIEGLGSFDVVYSWGVLHHTGDMWKALDNAAKPVRPGGTLVVAIYNDQGWRSKYWKAVKALYNKSGVFKWVLIAAYSPYFVVLRYIVRALSGKGKLDRGMSLWYDMIDWLGGYPFEVASPQQVVAFYVERAFSLTGIRTCGGRSGCNEYVFRKASTAATP